MSVSLPALEEYDNLVPVARAIYEHTSSLSWSMLLPLFLVSIAAGYTSGLGISGTFILRLQRLFVVSLLLIAFPTIAEFSQILGVEVAKSIDDLTGIDFILDAASKKAESYSLSLKSLLEIGYNVLFGFLVSISFILVVIARFFLLAFQHFYWLLLVSLGPFLILCSLFESASGITKNLFKHMFQVACWPVIWAVLSAFLKALPFASVYETEGGPIPVITLNVLIFIALITSPFIIPQLTEGVNLSVGDRLKSGAMRMAKYANPKVAVAATAAKYVSRPTPGR